MQDRAVWGAAIYVADGGLCGGLLVEEKEESVYNDCFETTGKTLKDCKTESNQIQQ